MEQELITEPTTSGPAAAPEIPLAGSPDLRALVHPSCGAWTSYRMTLRPRYGMVAMEMALCLAMMIGGYAASLWLCASRGNLLGLETGPLFALWIGFWLSALLSFGHEGAHYNLAADRGVNDTLGDWTIWLFFPESTKSYRKSHWQHHLHLGEAEDTEISYRNCLSPWFIAKALTGIYLVTLISRYVFGGGATKHNNDALRADTPNSRAGSERLVPVLRTAATHSLFIGIALLLRCYAAAAIWVVAVVFVFPALTSIRQILEHRAAEAACALGVGEGELATNRIFGRDIFSRYFGAAGFNRHLLHHWDPTVSYTRFDEMQAFLDGTPLGRRVAGATTNYFSSFCTLLKRATHDS